MKKTDKLKTAYFTLSLVLLAALLAFIFYLSSQTASESSETSASLIKIIKDLLGIFLSQEQIRTTAHFCEFMLLGFLTNNAVFSKIYETRRLLSVILAWCYAWSDEIHQIFVEGRAFQLIDLTVDLAGITAGVFIFCLLVKIIELLKKRRCRNG